MTMNGMRLPSRTAQPRRQSAGPRYMGLRVSADGSLNGNTAVPARLKARSPVMADGQRNSGNDRHEAQPRHGQCRSWGPGKTRRRSSMRVPAPAKWNGGRSSCLAMVEPLAQGWVLRARISPARPLGPDRAGARRRGGAGRQNAPAIQPALGTKSKVSPRRTIRPVDGDGKCAVHISVEVSQTRSNSVRRVSAACLAS